ncbi:hypothetical protein M9Y10_003135 [Tritrichomonas musculus]|uniref:Uncharacterized protein n=1 Tax=Tritrichomonas musculus TaxID=1915356 RepID=A0ABR2JPY6_9EUKA
MKYNLIDGLLELMKLNISHKIKEYYFNTIYRIIDFYFDTLNELSVDNTILVKEMQKVENPFSVYFENFYTILPNIIENISLPDRKSNSTITHINDYFKSINNVKSFWVSFIFGNRKYEKNSYEEIYPLMKVRNKLKNAENDISEMDINDYFLEEFCRKELLQNLVSNSCTFQNEQIIETIYSAIGSITQNEVAFISVLDIINRFMEDKKDENNFLSTMKKIIDLLMFMSEDRFFEKHFIDSV